MVGRWSWSAGMEDDVEELFRTAVPVWELALRSSVIYMVLLVGLRLSGKREIGQFTLIDLVLVLLVSNAVQPAMTGPDSSLIGGVVIVLVLLSLTWALGWLRLRSVLVRGLLESHPTVIAQDGHWLPTALQREGVDMEEAEMALREHGIDAVEGVKLAVLELDGTISVVPASSISFRTRRKMGSTRPRT